MPLIRVNHFYKQSFPGDVLDVTAAEADLILSHGGGSLVAAEAAGTVTDDDDGDSEEGNVNNTPTPIDVLSEFGVPPRILALLQGAGVQTIDQYQDLDDPTRIKGIGGNAVKQIGQAIEEFVSAVLRAAEEGADDDEDAPADDDDAPED